MNYLKQNLDNSLILPYDVMRTIYEYADFFAPIRRQIENKECNLDEIMYNRMKKRIKTQLINTYPSYQVSHPVSYNSIFINATNIDDISLRDKLLNWNHGYKHYYLWKAKNTPMICGIETHYSPKCLTSEYFRYKMIAQLETANPEYKHTYVLYMMSSTEIYDLWINI
jgi:hypothetical protein